MQWQEFVELQQCLIQWHQVFTQYDHDRSGFIEANELVNIVTNLFSKYIFMLHINLVFLGIKLKLQISPQK